jgi:hypothetical protein
MDTDAQEQQESQQLQSSKEQVQSKQPEASDEPSFALLESEPMYCAEQIRIPPQLPDIMKNYTKFIIREKPANIIEASAA